MTQVGTLKSLPAVQSETNQWWFFCLLIVSLKFSLLALDPLPKMFMGDSWSYLWTAFTWWIPDDRSYLYGFVIRGVALSTESLTSLLLLQSFISEIGRAHV